MSSFCSFSPFPSPPPLVYMYMNLWTIIPQSWLTFNQRKHYGVCFVLLFYFGGKGGGALVNIEWDCYLHCLVTLELWSDHSEAMQKPEKPWAVERWLCACLAGSNVFSFWADILRLKSNSVYLCLQKLWFTDIVLWLCLPPPQPSRFIPPLPQPLSFCLSHFLSHLSPP